MLKKYAFPFSRFYKAPPRPQAGQRSYQYDTGFFALGVCLTALPPRPRAAFAWSMGFFRGRPDLQARQGD